MPENETPRGEPRGVSAVSFAVAGDIFCRLLYDAALYDQTVCMQSGMQRN